MQRLALGKNLSITSGKGTRMMTTKELQSHIESVVSCTGRYEGNEWGLARNQKRDIYLVYRHGVTGAEAVYGNLSEAAELLSLLEGLPSKD
jgi:hypothetical protein